MQYKVHHLTIQLINTKYVSVFVKKTNHFRKCALETQLDAFLGSLIIDVPKYQELWKVCIFVFPIGWAMFQYQRGDRGSKSPRKGPLPWEDNIKKFGTAPELWLPFAVKWPMNGKMNKYRVKTRQLRRARLEAKRIYYMKSMLRWNEKRTKIQQLNIWDSAGEEQLKTERFHYNDNFFKKTIGKKKMITSDLDKTLVNLV